MSNLIVKWTASSLLRKQEAIATGSITTLQREMVIDLTTLTPAQRAAIVEIASETYGPKPALVLDLTVRHTAVTQPPRYSAGEARNWSSTANCTFDAEPSLEQALALGAANAVVLQEARCNALAAQEAEKKREAEKKAREEAEKAETAARMTPLYRQIQPAAEAALAGDLEAIEAVYAAWPNGLRYDFNPDGGDSLDKRLNARKAELTKAQKEADKRAWIASHGSDHLKRACAAGHNCDRKYWIERAAQEYPGFTLDYEDHAEWQDRTCPSVRMLDTRDAILAAHPGVKATIVWLTAEPWEQKNEWGVFQNTEALVVSDKTYPKYLVYFA